MKTIDKIRELVAANPEITTSEAADALGLTRQRVSDVCRKEGLKLTRAYPVRVNGVTHMPKARVVTGGVHSSISHVVCGTISELLVVADLMARGYKPYTPMVKQRCHDIIAVTPCGEILTFEVRSGKRRVDGDGYTFAPSPGGNSSNHYAIVITGEPVIYKPDLDPAKERPKDLHRSVQSVQKYLNAVMKS